MKKNEKKSIHCKLFTITKPDGKFTENKLHDAQIIGRNLIISRLKDGYTSQPDIFYDEYAFQYSYNIPFDKKVTVGRKKDKYLNTKITYNGITGGRPWEQTCFTYLNPYQRLINSKNFNRLWLQQANSIMWVINIIVAVIAIIATLMVASISK